MKTSFATIMLLTLMSCSKTTEPAVQLQYQLEIIPSSSVSISWDTTFYQHDTTWTEMNFPDTAAADSFANVLKTSNLSVTDFWFPQVKTQCKVLLRVGSEVIVKLQKPDTSAKALGLRTRFGFPIDCFLTWRHYKYTKQ